MTEPVAEVLNTAKELVQAFGSHDQERYFAFFESDATFIFHTTPTVVHSRAEYEALWRSWESDDGFRVLCCNSSDPHVRVVGEVAVFTHDVMTRIRTHDVQAELRGRETIVFRRGARGWVAIHEHLSPAPDHLQN